MEQNADRDGKGGQKKATEYPNKFTGQVLTVPLVSYPWGTAQGSDNVTTLVQS